VLATTSVVTGFPALISTGPSPSTTSPGITARPPLNW
jgi:hypothetical protein